MYRYHGNQVSSSIPTALHTAFNTGRFTPGKPVMMIGTPAGLTLAGMVLL
ncbi:3-oxoacyl-[acyl-carrier-protein] synthase III C-terminal domain-containing protein, partial [Pseudomonas syringae group genomosp. 7]